MTKCEFLQIIHDEIQGILGQGLPAEQLSAKMAEVNERINLFIQENCV